MRYNTATLQHLPQTHSDHNPMCLTFENSAMTQNRERTFKFQACWMDHKQFAPFIQTAWNSYKGDFCRTIAEFKSHMEVWSREVFGSFKHRMLRCLARIEGIQ